MSAMPRYVPSLSPLIPLYSFAPALSSARCGAVWRRSSYSTGMNNCVETVVPAPGPLTVRDSKNRAALALSFPSATWTFFVGKLYGGSSGPLGRSSPGD
ncbi:DUF397 domain-containing protein [Streptomyces griseocarneus]|nr:DUF397 domain-containing protein [Streptomyces griseocarneus]